MPIAANRIVFLSRSVIAVVLPKLRRPVAEPLQAASLRRAATERRPVEASASRAAVRQSFPAAFQAGQGRARRLASSPQLYSSRPPCLSPLRLRTQFFV